MNEKEFINHLLEIVKVETEDEFGKELYKYASDRGIWRNQEELVLNKIIEELKDRKLFLKFNK